MAEVVGVYLLQPSFCADSRDPARHLYLPSDETVIDRRDDRSEGMLLCKKEGNSRPSRVTIRLTIPLSNTDRRTNQVVAEKIGVSFRVPLEKRLNGAAAVGDHKTSMLQDVESGRTTELGALVGSVVEIAALTETAVPHLSTIYALSLLLDKKLEHGGLQVQLSKPAAK